MKVKVFGRIDAVGEQMVERSEKRTCRHGEVTYVIELLEFCVQLS